MTVEKRLENALSISENIKDGKICPNNLYDLQLHISDALEQVKKLTIPVVVNRQGTVNLKPLEKIQERIDRLTKLKKEFEAYEDSDIIHKKELELLAERIKTLKWVVLN